MGLPSVDAAELVALRDGEPVEVGVTYAHEANVEVRRALLEARLFALALSLPKTMPQGPAQPLDADLALDYLTGALPHPAARAFEATVRGDPRSFAALIEFKDAVFGRATTQVSTVDVPLPPMQRIELGVLSVQVVGRTTLLRWTDNVRRSDFSSFGDEVRLSFLTRMIDPFEEQARLFERMVMQQADLGNRLREVQGELMMARKSNRLMQLERVRDKIAQLEELARRLTGELNRTKGSVDELLGDLAAQRLAADRAYTEDWSRESVIEVFDCRLAFHASATPGALGLRLTAPGEAKHEFTWVRPDKDFRVLEPNRLRIQTFGVVEEECLLLVDALGQNGETTSVLRVRRLEDVRA